VTQPSGPAERPSDKVEPEESALIERARGGDRDAFGVLVDRHHAAVMGFLMTVGRDADLAEDCAQEAFLKAFRSLNSFEGRSSFRTWVSRIALNEVRGRWRWNKVRGLLSLGQGEDAEVDVESLRTDAGSSDELAALERRMELERALAGLGRREREIAALRLEGYALHEIAELLGISEGTVKSTLFDATRKMRERLS